MTTADLDLVHYTNIPILEVARIVTLTTELLARVPKNPTPGVRKAARKVRTSLEALRAGWEAKKPAPKSEQVRRKADTATDNAWSALQRRLGSYGQLPVERYPNAPRAVELNEQVFPDGLRFLTLPWKTQWAEGDKRLQQIDKGNLASDIDRLAGPEFLAEVRFTHDEYGKALGIATPLPEEEATPTMGEPLVDLRRALKRYALQLVATADEEHPETVDAVIKALTPIDEARPDRTATPSDAPGETPDAPDGTKKDPEEKT